MELIAEIIANLLLVFGVFIFRWCIRHKNLTAAFFVAALVAVDIIFLLRWFHVI